VADDQDVLASPTTLVDPADTVAEADAPLPASARRPITRRRAFLEVLLCSGLPTQLAAIQILVFGGLQPLDAAGRLSSSYMFLLLLLDSIALVGLILLLLRVDGEDARSLFLGRRPPGREALLGLLSTPVVLLVATGVIVMLRVAYPWLQNVPRNPLEDLIRTTSDAILFGLVSIVAGGLREEVQRAFVLHRFEHHLGGAAVGLVVFTVLFALGHVVQGWDAAIATGVLGAAWGAAYLWRRSIVLPAVSHAAFNLTEVAYHSLTAVN
jgi:membrane protease YdiL (CAAX protease family)